MGVFHAQLLLGFGNGSTLKDQQIQRRNKSRPVRARLAMEHHRPRGGTERVDHADDSVARRGLPGPQLGIDQGQSQGLTAFALKQVMGKAVLATQIDHRANAHGGIAFKPSMCGLVRAVHIRRDLIEVCPDNPQKRMVEQVIMQR